MAKRKKALEPALTGYGDFDAATRRLCELDVETRELEARRDKWLMYVKSRYAEKLAAIASDRKGLAAQCEQFVRAHLDDVAPAKSIDRAYAVASLRDCPPAVKLKGGKRWNAEKIIAACEAVTGAAAEVFRTFVAVKKSIDKPAVLAAHRDKTVTDAELAKCGLAVAAGEAFNIDLKLDSIAKHRPDAGPVEDRTDAA